MKKILVTGAAGFIGFHLSKKLLSRGDQVIGLDNLNDYYDVLLKENRLQQIKDQDNFTFYKIDLTNQQQIEQLFADHKFDVVVNLAAQAGVRYSLINPRAYIDSNLVGFTNILEGCRHHQVKHLVFASSSSVYGSNTKIPFSVHDNVDHPVSLYAASKKANELMAHTYSHLYRLPCTGLRFFTVYGPWGRPDMAMFLFTDAIVNNKPIKVFNYGKMERDFTYVDDIVEGVVRILEHPNKDRIEKNDLYKVYNIGNNNSVKLLDFIKEIELNLGTEAEKNMLPIQPGDVERTWANVDDLIKDYNYKPNTPISHGVKAFIDWYKSYYN